MSATAETIREIIANHRHYGRGGSSVQVPIGVLEDVLLIIEAKGRPR